VLFRSLRAAPFRHRLLSCQTSSVLICPAKSPTDDLAGAIFIVFDGSDHLPNGAELAELTAGATRAGCQIAALLELCGPTARRMSRAAAA